MSWHVPWNDRLDCFRTQHKLPNLCGRVCIVTGATSGVGLQVASELAKRGARVVVAGRTAASAERAAQLIQL